jgi:hypothetical protein
MVPRAAEINGSPPRVAIKLFCYALAMVHPAAVVCRIRSLHLSRWMVDDLRANLDQVLPQAHH